MRSTIFTPFITYILFWTLFFCFIFLVRYYDSGDFGFHQFLHPIAPARIWGNGLVLGIMVGISYAMMEQVLEQVGIYTYAIGRIIMIRVFVHFLVTTLLLSGVSYVNYLVDARGGTLDPNLVSFHRYLLGGTVLIVFIAAFIGNVLLTMFRTLQMKIGSSQFYALLLGRYRTSREEHKIFLFIDLQSSTSLAEKLGHVQYSYFIQDCFKDLHPAVMKTNAFVYQYVGDEAVLVWDMETGKEQGNCLRAFFLFNRQLKRRADYYLQTYGVAPVFKGGLNLGMVMTAEVGVIRREIAYHSDVLNTASRIQGISREKSACLMASEAVYTQLTHLDGFVFVPKGFVQLRGKTTPQQVYEVQQALD